MCYDLSFNPRVLVCCQLHLHCYVKPKRPDKSCRGCTICSCHQAQTLTHKALDSSPTWTGGCFSYWLPCCHMTQTDTVVGTYTRTNKQTNTHTGKTVDSRRNRKDTWSRDTDASKKDRWSQKHGVCAATRGVWRLTATNGMMSLRFSSGRRRVTAREQKRWKPTARRDFLKSEIQHETQLTAGHETFTSGGQYFVL